MTLRVKVVNRADVRVVDTGERQRLPPESRAGRFHIERWFASQRRSLRTFSPEGLA
jgi:hypothetical protein